MTKQEFAKLPLLLKPAQVKEVTGYSDNTLKKLEQEGRLSVKPTRGGQRRFRKVEICKLVGMEDAL